MQEAEKQARLKQVIDSGFVSGNFEIVNAVEKMVDRWDSINKYSLEELNYSIEYLSAVKAAIENILIK